ncbi:hypothetical protein TNCV_214021 [Trichonephila clavipes]|nr:hypothetical protein TNCV_214021 [Trichonephila clavipes]
MDSIDDCVLVANLQSKNRGLETEASRRIRGPPAKSGFGPQVRSYKRYVLSVSQTLGPLEFCPPPRCGGVVRYAMGSKPNATEDPPCKEADVR